LRVSKPKVFIGIVLLLAALQLKQHIMSESPVSSQLQVLPAISVTPKSPENIVNRDNAQPKSTRADASPTSYPTEQTFDDPDTPCELNGSIMFERIEFSEAKSDLETHYQLRPYDPVEYPSRYVKVILRDREHIKLATTRTNSEGLYHFQFDRCSPNQLVYIEVVAEMKVTSIDPANGNTMVVSVFSHHVDFKTNKRAQYSVTNDYYFSITPGINTRDMLLETGFDRLDGFSETKSKSQPFAILDTLVKGFELFKGNNIDIPINAKALKVLWSRGVQADTAAGGYYDAKNNLLFIRGSLPIDDQERPKTTNSEWNEHVILHELGHWYMHQVIGRSDSRGGAHAGFMFSDLTLALSESIAGAIARLALNDWQDKRATSEINQVTTANNFDAVVNNQLQQHVRYFKHSNGQPYNRPAFAFSPFDETSNMLFLLSLMDNRAQFSDLATILAHEIGFVGLHQALLRTAKKADPFTIYSLGEQLINDYPLLAGELILLAKGLNIAIESGSCGDAQWPLDAHVIDDGGRLLDHETQFPICTTLPLNESVELNFSGALQSTSAARPGTVRYVYFTPPYDATVTITADNQNDSTEYPHRFSFDVSLHGLPISRSQYVPKQLSHQSRLSLRGNKTYVIRLVDTSYQDKSYKSEETLSMTLSIDLD